MVKEKKQSEPEHNSKGNQSELKEIKNIRDCAGKFQYKEEEDVYTGLIATTHPDRVGDILSVNSLQQIASYINDGSKVGDEHGAYRAVSLAHDWIKEGNPELDPAAMLQPNARIVELDNGHKGVEVNLELNQYYSGDITSDEIKYRLDNDYYGGLSIEYDTDESHTRPVISNGKEFRFIESLTEFGGSGLARPRLIANPYAVMYKEIESQVIGEKNMVKEEKKLNVKEEEVKSEVPENTEEKSEEQPKVEESAEEKSEEKSEPVLEEKEMKFDVKELLKTKEFKDAVIKELEVKNKVLNIKEEKMDNIPLSVKEMTDSLSAKEFDSFSYKQAALKFVGETKEFEDAFRTTGIALNTTLQVKCEGNKLRIVGNLQTKNTLDTTTNPTTYTQSIVEFADVYQPGIVDTFNNSTNLFGALRKVDHIEGGNYYGWRIKTTQQNTLSVDPNNSAVNKIAVDKLKLRTDIKEYRLGVSVSDYTLQHSRASMGDLFMIEVESVSRDLLKDINGDLFTAQVDTAGTKILGLQAVADSATNTAMYGLTRTTANRLAPDAAADTYVAVGGALTTALMRNGAMKVEVEGANRGNLRIIVNPNQRDKLFELEAGNQRYGEKAKFGFDGVISYDGMPMIVDPDCQTDALFIVDFESYYIVMSRAPQLIGLAKVGAAEEAYISTYLAAVYEQPRRIHQLDTLA